MSRPLPPLELEEAVRIAGDWASLAGARLFITGGTGFFGRWLLEALGAAEGRHRLGLRATVLSRDPERFLRTAPHLREAPWLTFLAGDLREVRLPEMPVTHLIHGAASSDARDYARDPQAMRRGIALGAERIAAWMAGQPSLEAALFISSGAVYGPQPAGLERLPEDHPLPPDTEEPSQAYAQGKREAERSLAAAAAAAGIRCPLARCFAFAGPHLPLDQHFAFGNFIRDALAGGPIRVSGDGSPRRSYLYASELAGWLFALLLRGGSRSYQVGSDVDLSILDLARAVASASGTGVEVAAPADPGRPPARYVPEARRIREELGLEITVPLSAAIQRTLDWHRSGGAA